MVIEVSGKNCVKDRPEEEWKGLRESRSERSLIPGRNKNIDHVVLFQRGTD
jgi:hypothetical protein